MNPVTRAKANLIFAVAAFGTIGIFVRGIGLPSSVIALVRGAVGAAFLLLLARLRHTPIDRGLLRRRLGLLVLSSAMMSFNWITLFESYRYTTVATATLCYYMAPIFVTLASPFLFHEKLTPRKLLCVLAALCGFLMDLALGDPAWMPHPVVGMGKCIAALERGLRRAFPKTPRGELAAGAVLAVRVIRAALRRFRGQMVWLILGLMAGSLYAIVMGPAGLQPPQPPVSPQTFSLPGFLLGTAALLLPELLRLHHPAEAAPVRSTGEAEA